MKIGFVPQRTCVACRKKQDKKDLLRIVKSGENVVVDIGGKTDGRGVYVCKDTECAAALKKKKGLNRAFKGVVPESVYDDVIATVIKSGEDKND